tara:strand:+ start:683 stop:1267 length:585 start_codon:yes stop_codon:yes gene_type:complete
MDYQFNNLTRSNCDTDYIDERNLQNTAACNYTFDNYFTTPCSFRRTAELATSQPGVNFTGTKGICPSGSNISDNNRLRYAASDNVDKCCLDLFSRPYVTIPCLKRGYGNILVESDLQQGQITSTRKIYNDTTTDGLRVKETNYVDYNIMPLLPSKSKVIQNPQNLIEERANKDWVRGGIDTKKSCNDTNIYVTY